jgi:hypothetical protein
MEGTGKNLRLTQNPPFNFEGRRVFDATTGAGTASTGFEDITPNVNGGPGTPVSHLCSQPATGSSPSSGTSSSSGS